MNTHEVRADFQLLGTRIVELKVSNDFVYVDLNDEDIERTIEVSYDLDTPFRFDDGKLAGKAIVEIVASLKKEELLMDVQLILEGCFVLEDDDAEETLNEMLATSGTAALYSIGRGIISGITSQVCVNGTLLLPMVNMFELKEKTEHE